MNIELKVLTSLSRLLPAVRGAGLIPIKLLIPFYNRKKRQSAIVKVFNFIMELDPKENVDSALLFYPHLYDKLEMKFLKENLKIDSNFIDIGANIGLFSFVAADIIKHGKILAIEADPFNFHKLEKNIFLNHEIKNITAINIGVSDKEEILKLYINDRGNRGGNSFLKVEQGRPTIDIECKTLLTILTENKVTKIDGLKIDIEGFEFKVLKTFFNNAPKELHPKFILTEYHPSLDKLGGGSTLDLLQDQGYKIHLRDNINFILIK